MKIIEKKKSNILPINRIGFGTGYEQLGYIE